MTLISTLLLMSACSFSQATDTLPTQPDSVQSFTLSHTPRFEPAIEIFGQKVDLSRYVMHERYERELTNTCW